ncbi:hypothetical protein ABW21_db0207861 [Orbilia brochopaga]|nr:hypothetical protein ABW21_db0207861 [Drechslerella brochopaga]
MRDVWYDALPVSDPSWRPRLTVTNLEITRQRHEERMAERRRGAGGRAVTQSFGFDLPLIIATPPAVRAQKIAAKADTAKPIIEQPTTVTNTLEPVTESPQRRQSARLSRGNSVVSATPVRDVVAESEGSSRKRRKVDSRSPSGTVSSKRSASMRIEGTPDIASNGRPTPEITTTESEPAPIPLESVRKTPVIRSSPRVSARRSLAPPASSVGLSSPSPLSAQSTNPVANSSVSPEPLRFIPDPSDSEIAITPEVAKTPIDETILSTPLAAATGLRTSRRRSSRPAVAAMTPVPRGKRRRQPSPDKFLTPAKAASQELEGSDDPDDEDPDLSVEQIGLRGTDASKLANGHAEPENEPEPEVINETIEPAQPIPKRRGRKPKVKKPSVEIPVEELPIQEEEAVLSDVEPEVVEESYDQVVINGHPVEEEEGAVYEEVIAEEEEEEELEEPADEEVVNPNNIDIINEFLLEIIDKQLKTLSLRKNEERDREEKARMKIREAVVANFSSALENRFIGMASKADNIKMKSVELRRLQREKLQLRDELMQIRESREDVARQMDSVRKKHEEGSEKANRQQFINDTLRQIEGVLEQGASVSTAHKGDTLPASQSLDALLASVTEDLCGPVDDDTGGGGKGILEQVKDMNRFLEAATEALQRGR